MANAIPLGVQRIEVEADWSLRQLLTFCSTYEQLYSVLYPLQPNLHDSLRGEGVDRLTYLYRAFPWRGGYSAVNFYDSQRYLIPAEARPSIRRIRIESPGFIDLGVAIGTAFAMHRVVTAFSQSAGLLAGLYHDIYKQMQERKLMRINVKREEFALAKDQMEYAASAQKALGEAMNLPEAVLIQALADNPLAALKITLSIFRRARTLSKAERRGQIELKPPAEDT